MTDVAICVEGLGRQYRIGGPRGRFKCKSLVGAVSRVRRLLGPQSPCPADRLCVVAGGGFTCAGLARLDSPARTVIGAANMEHTVLTPFRQALDVVEQLSVKDQETLIEIVQRRLVEQRREEITHNARATLQAFREGRAGYGTMDDLRRDLLEES
jgi:hypothetical protein